MQRARASTPRGSPGAAIRRIKRLNDVLIDREFGQLPRGQRPNLPQDNFRIAAKVRPGAGRIHRVILGDIGVVLIKTGLPSPAIGAAEIALNHIGRCRKLASMGLKSIDHALAIDFALHSDHPEVAIHGPGIGRVSLLGPHASIRQNGTGNQNRQYRRHQQALQTHGIHPLLVKGRRIGHRI
ncbi:MAG: hypothetical protein LW713_06025 [Acetobacteraceae bacterium]|nr:hypothetical protein [Acetobacteraceae bacterium]